MKKMYIGPTSSIQIWFSYTCISDIHFMWYISS